MVVLAAFRPWITNNEINCGHLKRLEQQVPVSGRCQTTMNQRGENKSRVTFLKKTAAR